MSNNVESKNILNKKSLVQCVLCKEEVRTRIFKNHLMNQHGIDRDNIERLIRLHFSKKFNKFLKRQQNGVQTLKMKKCHKKPMIRASLKTHFENAIQDSQLSISVFSQLLMDVSRDYHKSKINRGIENEDIKKTFSNASLLNASQDLKGDLKMKINVSSQKVEKVEDSSNTSKLLDETLIQKELTKEETQNTLTENIFLESSLDTGDFTQTVGKRTIKMKTSTPKQRKAGLKSKKGGRTGGK